jgi:hypothetical protein
VSPNKHSAKTYVPSVPRLALGKAFFAECLPWASTKHIFNFFFILPTKLFVACFYTL